MRVMLEGSNSVLVDDGYVSSLECALSSPADFRPFLFPVPDWISEHRDLMDILGVQPSFREVCFRAALAKRALQGPLQLPEEEVTVAVAMVNAAVEALHADNGHEGAALLPRQAPELEMWVPDAEGYLARPEELYFNDAEWLADREVRMLHPGVSQVAAEALGVRSLRHFHQVQQSKTHQLPCPPASLVQVLLQKQDDPEAYALFDIAEFADACGCEAMDVWLDFREHGKQSLLLPGLSGFQVLGAWLV